MRRTPREGRNRDADLSRSRFDAFVRSPEYDQSFLERHHDSPIFGTDASYLPDDTIPHIGYFMRFGLPTGAWEIRGFRNLERVLV